jgi:poly(A) polymerase
LHQAPDSVDRRLVEAALASTDSRIAEDKHVTPAFLLAALLWPAAKRALAEVDPESEDLPLAAAKAVARIVKEQTERIALPKRFALPMQEIWALQPRFAERRKKAVQRFLSHPRFRAAYDFLVLRGSSDPAAAAQAQWWSEAQAARPVELERLLVAPSADSSAANESVPASPRRRRRRRRRRAGGSAPSAPDQGA